MSDRDAAARPGFDEVCGLMLCAILCYNLEDAAATARLGAVERGRALAVANPDRGAYENRPVEVYRPGALPGAPLRGRAIRAQA